MAWQEESVAAGFNNAAGYTNLEDYFDAPFLTTRVPDGSVTDDALSGRRRVDGHRRVFLKTGGCSVTELNAYVTAVFGGWTGSRNADVTLRCRGQDNAYADWNAIAYRPLDGTDFQRVPIDAIDELQLEFLVVSEAS